MWHWVRYLLIIGLLVSCTKPDIVQPEIVLEGWIEDDGHPFVMIHNSYTASERYNSVQEVIENKTIFWGKVTISKDDYSDVMTGHLDTMYLPPYYYSSVEIKGKSGNSYQIKAEYDGQFVTATTTIPSRVEFDSISIEVIDEKRVKLMGYLQDVDSADNYYVLFYRYRGDKQYVNCFLGVVSDKEADQEGFIKIPIYNNISVNNLKENVQQPSRFFALNDTLDIKLSAVDKISYEIWMDISSLSTTSSIAFMPVYKNIKTNIVGGKGYWCGYASSVYRLVLNKDTTYGYNIVKD
ncbi:MAG: hypothetical protein IJY67_04145 [Paludibacteraceae bacterium]|nr:hypothetical protein [Paludibacteraceae bacterium]